MNAKKRRALAVGLLALAVAGSGCGSAEEPITRIEWSRTEPLSGHVQDGAVRVSAPVTGATFPLATLEGPQVPSDGYAVLGEVRYESVSGRGFLEMWSEFADGGRYFSRTLASEGPQASLSGSSDWRAFELPFYLEGGPTPVRLDIAVVLPGSGTVEVGSLQLVPLGRARGWWSERAGGLAGGVGGALIGIFGGLIGWLVSRRRARAFVLRAMSIAVAIGVVLLGVGVAGLIGSQPYAVVYPSLLSGAILVVVFGGLLPTVRRAYADHELRRMHALDQG